MIPSNLGPHFCTWSCHLSHATTDDLAADAAELCQRPEHFRYDDTSPAAIAEHVAAHLAELER